MKSQFICIMSAVATKQSKTIVSRSVDIFHWNPQTVKFGFSKRVVCLDVYAVDTQFQSKTNNHAQQYHNALYNHYISS